MPTKVPEEKYQKLERLFELADALGQQTDFDEILRVVTQQVASLLRAEMLVFYRVLHHKDICRNFP